MKHFAIAILCLMLSSGVGYGGTNAVGGLDDAVAAIRSARSATNSPIFKAKYRRMEDIVRKIETEKISVEQGWLQISRLYVGLLDDAKFPLADAKKVIDSLFLSRYMLAEKDRGSVMQSVQASLRHLQERHPRDPDLYLLEVYGLDMWTEQEVLQAKAALRRCLEIAPQHEKCRTMLKRLEG